MLYCVVGMVTGSVINLMLSKARSMYSDSRLHPVLRDTPVSAVFVVQLRGGIIYSLS